MPRPLTGPRRLPGRQLGGRLLGLKDELYDEVFLFLDQYEDIDGNDSGRAAQAAAEAVTEVLSGAGYAANQPPYDPSRPAHWVQEHELPGGNLIAATAKAQQMTKLLREIGELLTDEVKELQAVPASQAASVRAYNKRLFEAQDAGYPIVGALYDLLAALDRAAKERPL